MKQQNKFSTGRHQEQAAESHAANSASVEFRGVEDLLRHDAAQMDVPPEIARRLSQSIAQSSTPRRPWWRRLLD